MKKYVSDLLVNETERLHEDYVQLRLTDPQAPLPPMSPGQFVEIRVDESPSTFLRRPISIHYVDRERNELWLLVHIVGDGTRKLATLRKGDRLNCLYPLGHGYTVPDTAKHSETFTRPAPAQASSSPTGCSLRIK